MASMLWSAAAPALAARGSDSFGYRWYDSSEPECPEVDVTTVGIPSLYAFGSDDEVSPAVPIGFNFPFYTGNYSQVYISTNGFISFIPTAGSAPNPGSIPSGTAPNGIAATLWADLVPASIAYGLVTGSETYFVVRWFAGFKGSTRNFITEVRLYPSGRIVHAYGNDFDSFSPAEKAKFVTGIEDASGTRGLMSWNRGTGLNGYTFPGWHSTCFLPPPRIGCFAGPVICNGSVSGSTAGGIRDVNGYSCAPGLYDGAERTYTLSLANLSDLTLSLSGLGGRNLELFLLDGCDENLCLGGGSASLSRNLLAPGNYAVAIDGSIASEGAYTLSATCVQRGFPASCGSSEVGSIGSGASSFDAYDCAPGSFFPGPESFYDVTLAAPGNLRAQITGACELDALVFRAGELDAASCLAHGEGGVVLYDAPAGSYVIAVEGRNGDACPFTIDFSCGIDLQCGSPQATLQCGDRVSGTTAGRPDVVHDYGCRPNLRYDGGESLYQITAPAGQSVGARLLNASSPDLEAFLLDACNEGACLDAGTSHAACEPSVSVAGTRYLVVDGRNGASGSFELEVVCGPAESDRDWRICEGPDRGTTLDTRAATEWRWYTPIPSPIEPDPVPLGSYCGTGCDLSFYLPVNCGQSLHLVFDDVESAGGVTLTELGSGRRAVLDATNNGGKGGSNPWSASGQQIEWLSDPCTGHAPPIPPQPWDLGSDDPRFNDAVLELSLGAGENPCGLWRLDLASMGGVHWGMLGNCAGGLVPGYTIYDNICDAQAAFAPKAELQVSNLRTTGTCPNLTVSFDLENLGCATVDAPWRIDAGPASILDGAELGLAPGARVSISRALTIGGTGKVKAIADALAALTECSEALGDACSTSGVHEIELQACAGCAGPNPPVLEIGNTVWARKLGADAELSWPLAPTLSAASASHYHVYRTDRKNGGTWTNLATPDTLATPLHQDPAPPFTRNFYQVRFANDCEEISGSALP